MDIQDLQDGRRFGMPFEEITENHRFCIHCLH